MSEPQQPQAPAEPAQIRFHQIKSNFFRVIHADGAWASVGPHEYVHLTFYNERLAIPQELSYKLTETDHLGLEVERKTREGFVREMEVDVMINRAGAVGLHRWLSTYLENTAPVAPKDINTQ